MKPPFSNFFYSPFIYKSHKLKFSEQGFMLEKAMLFGDPQNHFNQEAVRKILEATQPIMAKKAGREVKDFVNADWDKVRYSKMVNVLKAKFKDPLLNEV